jgi:peptide/histidine transporter 3/4
MSIQRELSSDVHSGEEEEADPIPGGAGSLLTDPTSRRRRQGSQRNCGTCRYRWINNKGAFMVLAWNMLVFSYQHQALESILKLIPHHYEWHPWLKMSTHIALDHSLPLLLYPLAGWLADTKLGRYRVMKGSIWIMWGASICLLLTHIVQYTFIYVLLHNKKNVYFRSLPFAIVLYIANAIGLAGFQANIIPFGIDQIEDGSAGQCSSFVHWYYWTRNFSLGLVLRYILFSVVFHCESTQPEQMEKLNLVALLFEISLLNLALLLDVWFFKVLVIEPKAWNPLKTVFNVSRFIVRHKQPVGPRSALTYERGYYSRSDLATLPYGGPFEVEDVADVKTFWRMIVFLVFVASAVIPIYTVNFVMTYLVGPPLLHAQRAQHCQLNYFIINASNPLVFVVALPVYELVVYPVIHKYVLPMMHRIGIGYFLGLLAVMVSIVFSFIGRHSKHTCVFFNNDDRIHLSEWMVLLPILVSGFAEMLVFIPAYEFICAQAPFNMRGLLVGCFYALQGLASGISALLLFIFAEGYTGHKSLHTLHGCDFSFSVVILLFGVVGLIAYSVVVRWYKKRERDYLGREGINHRAVLEAYYENNNNTV